MSASPSKKSEVPADAEADVAHDSGGSNPETQAAGDHGESGDQAQEEAGAFYEIDVKEQDRWLPIANGTL